MTGKFSPIFLFCFLFISILSAQKISKIPLIKAEDIEVNLIERDFNNHKIDINERINYLVSALKNPASLPERYRETKIEKCGSWISDLVIQNWDKLNANTKAKMETEGFRSALGNIRPIGVDEAFLSKHFKFHFSTDDFNFNSVDPRDDDNNGNPDYIDRVADAFEKTFQYFMDSLNYYPPPSDSLAGLDYGGDSRYDIYVMDIANSTYGITYSESILEDNPNSPEKEKNPITSYIAMRNEYNSISNDPVGAMQVTAAHEYFHAVQNGIDGYEKPWLKEATAAWMEDVIFPDVDDNFQYLRSFFNYPWSPLDANTAEFKGHWYSSWIFFQYLSEAYGNEVVTKIWNKSRENDSNNGDYSFDNIEEALNEEFSSFAEEFQNFIIANLVKTDAPYDYQQGEFFPPVNINLSIYWPYYGTGWALQRHTSRYMKVTPNFVPDGNDEITFTGMPQSGAKVGFAIITKSAGNYNYQLYSPSSNTINFTLNDSKTYDEIYFVAFNDTKYKVEYNFNIITHTKLAKIEDCNFEYSQTNANFNSYKLYENNFNTSNSENQYYYKLISRNLNKFTKDVYFLSSNDFVNYLSASNNNNNMILEINPEYPSQPYIASFNDGNFNQIALDVNDTSMSHPHYQYIDMIKISGDSAYLHGTITPINGSPARGIWNYNFKSKTFNLLMSETASQVFQGFEITDKGFIALFYESGNDKQTIYRYNNSNTAEVFSIDNLTEGSIRRMSYSDNMAAFYTYDIPESKEKIFVRDFDGDNVVYNIAANNDIDDISLTTKNKKIIWAEETGTIWNSTWRIKIWENNIVNQIYTNNRYIVQQTPINPDRFDQRISISDKGIAWMEMNVNNPVEYYFYYYQFSNAAIYTLDLSSYFGYQPELKIDLMEKYAVITVSGSQSENCGGIYVIDISKVITGTSNENPVKLYNYALSQNYPNPFNPETTINFILEKPGIVKLKVFDLLGREVKVLVNDFRSAGKYKESFNGGNLASGIYFYSIEAGEFRKTKKMILLK